MIHHPKKSKGFCKAKFFHSPSTAKQSFYLIESLLFENGAFFLANLHWQRLRKSARFFGFKFDMKRIEEKILSIKNGLITNNQKRYKVRFTLEKEGYLESNVEEVILSSQEEKRKVAIATQRVDSSDIFLRHKTSIYRKFYDKEVGKKEYASLFSLIFLNERDEITESSGANVFIKKNQEILTPPLDSGLLPGTFREHLLRENKCQEKILYSDDLKNADQVFLGNSVRRMMEVKVL